MKKYNKKDLIEYRKKLVTLATAGTLVLGSATGCAANNKEQTVETTVAPTTIVETTVMPTTSIEVTNDVATEEYMAQAKAIATAMYDSNKEYFDDKQFTVEDLENTYYLINGKYYDFEGNLIMDQVELDRAFDTVRELVMPQRVNEMLQKLSDLDHGYISETEYFEEVEASKFYDYTVSLSNLIDKNKANEDLINYINEYSTEMYKVTEDLINGVSPEDHLTEFFAIIRSAQTGDTTEFEGINNYLQENSSEDGYGFLIADTYKTVADYINTYKDGQYVTVQDENVRIGFSYDEQLLINAYNLGDLTGNVEAILEAEALEAELFQTKPWQIMCNRQDKIQINFGYYDDNVYKKSL